MSAKAWLSLGLYWKPPRQPSLSVVAACHVSVDKGIAIPLADVPTRTERIRLGPLFRRSESRLFVDATEDFDPAEAFALLLEAADEALAVAAPDGGERISLNQ